MPESSQEVENIKYIKVGKSIELQSVLPTVVDIGEQTLEANMNIFFKEKHALNSLYNTYIEKQLNEQQLPEKLKQSEKLAKKLVNQTRLRIGLPEVPEDQMKCLYISDSDYAENFEHTGSIYGLDNADALHDSFFVAELVRKRDYPEYVTSSISAHEWVHRFIDMEVELYNENQVVGSPNQKVVQNERVRSGLSVRDVASKKIRNEILSELGNYYVQACYFREIVDKDDPIFRDDLLERETKITKSFGAGRHVGVTVTSSTGKTTTYAFTRELLHPSKSKVIFNVRATMFMQLAEDINVLCGDVDGEPFMNMVLRAKTNPKEIRKVKRVIDNKIGPDFFDKLYKARTKEESLEDLEDLLSDVQKIIYTIS